MRLKYAPLKNFGDALNPWLWPRLIPGVSVGDKEGPWFSGIGSWLTPSKIERFDDKIVVFGTGAGYESIVFSFGREFPWKTYPVRMDLEKRPLMKKKMRENFKFYCVRGPLTAALLGLKPETAITDPAVLLKTVPLPIVESSHRISFMPHCRTAASTAFPSMCRELSFQYIDPSGSVEEVLSKIRGSRILITEALHGAIVADAFRIPWIPVFSSDRILRFKWEDFCRSLGLTYDPVRIRPIFRGSKIVCTRVRPVFRSKIPLAARILIHARSLAGNLKNRGRALESLLHASSRTPVLSPEKNLQRAIERLQSVLESLKKDMRGGQWP